jgi:hypothetical protein
VSHSAARPRACSARPSDIVGDGTGAPDPG